MRNPAVGRVFLISVSSIAGSTELIRHVDVVLFEGVRWFGGLTCVFGGKNAQNNFGEGQDNDMSRFAAPAQARN